MSLRHRPIFNGDEEVTVELRAALSQILTTDSWTSEAPPSLLPLEEGSIEHVFLLLFFFLFAFVLPFAIFLLTRKWNDGKVSVIPIMTENHVPHSFYSIPHTISFSCTFWIGCEAFFPLARNRAFSVWFLIHSWSRCLCCSVLFEGSPIAPSSLLAELPDIKQSGGLNFISLNNTLLHPPPPPCFLGLTNVTLSSYVSMYCLLPFYMQGQSS